MAMKNDQQLYQIINPVIFSNKNVKRMLVPAS